MFINMLYLRYAITAFTVTFFTLCAARVQARGDKYLVGIGKADVTGPVVEIGMMGYASLDQKGTGLRQRLFSRAFIVGDVKPPNDCFVYVIADLQTGDTAIRNGVIEKLQTLYGGLYTQSNVAIVGTHSHSGPGWFYLFTLQLTSVCA